MASPRDLPETVLGDVAEEQRRLHRARASEWRWVALEVYVCGGARFTLAVIRAVTISSDLRARIENPHRRHHSRRLPATVCVPAARDHIQLLNGDDLTPTSIPYYCAVIDSTCSTPESSYVPSTTDPLCIQLYPATWTPTRPSPVPTDDPQNCSRLKPVFRQIWSNLESPPRQRPNPTQSKRPFAKPKSPDPKLRDPSRGFRQYRLTFTPAKGQSVVTSVDVGSDTAHWTYSCTAVQEVAPVRSELCFVSGPVRVKFGGVRSTGPTIKNGNTEI